MHISNQNYNLSNGRINSECTEPETIDKNGSNIAFF